MQFALFTITAMALWHRAGISSSSDGLGSCRTSLACVRVCVVLLGFIAIGVSVFGLGSMLFTVFLSLVMRLSFLVSDFVMGGLVLCFYLLGDVGSLTKSFGLGGDSCLYSPLPILLLCRFGRWWFVPRR